MNIPVATSVDGKGILLDSDDLYVGPVGTYARKCANKCVSEADLVFYIGTTVSDQLTVNWTIPAEGTKTIQLDIEAFEPGRNYPGTICLSGDVKVTLELLLDSIDSGMVSQSWTDECRSNVSEWWKSVEDLRKSGDSPITPERLCAEITDNLPADAVIVADTGYSAVWAGTQINMTSDDSGSPPFWRAEHLGGIGGQ